jgi:hypothetical protein
MVSELAQQLLGFTDLICLSVQSSDTLHKCIKPAKKFEAFFIECSDWDEIFFQCPLVLGGNLLCSDLCCDVEGCELCFVKSFWAALGC